MKKLLSNFSSRWSTLLDLPYCTVGFRPFLNKIQSNFFCCKIFEAFHWGVVYKYAKIFCICTTNFVDNGAWKFIFSYHHEDFSNPLWNISWGTEIARLKERTYVDVKPTIDPISYVPCLSLWINGIVNSSHVMILWKNYQVLKLHPFSKRDDSSGIEPSIDIIFIFTLFIAHLYSNFWCKWHINIIFTLFIASTRIEQFLIQMPSKARQAFWQGVSKIAL